jgi:hypothetical protein
MPIEFDPSQFGSMFVEYYWSDVRGPFQAGHGGISDFFLQGQKLYLQRSEDIKNFKPSPYTPQTWSEEQWQTWDQQNLKLASNIFLKEQTRFKTLDAAQQLLMKKVIDISEIPAEWNMAKEDVEPDMPNLEWDDAFKDLDELCFCYLE